MDARVQREAWCTRVDAFEHQLEGRQVVHQGDEPRTLDGRGDAWVRALGQDGAEFFAQGRGAGGPARNRFARVDAVALQRRVDRGDRIAGAKLGLGQHVPRVGIVAQASGEATRPRQGALGLVDGQPRLRHPQHVTGGAVEQVGGQQSVVVVDGTGPAADKADVGGVLCAEDPGELGADLSGGAENGLHDGVRGWATSARRCWRPMGVATCAAAQVPPVGRVPTGLTSRTASATASGRSSGTQWPTPSSFRVGAGANASDQRSGM